jgi:cell wall-associated NlpC family hydrolase
MRNKYLLILAFLMSFNSLSAKNNDFIRKTVKEGCPEKQHRNLTNLLLVNLSGELKTPEWQKPFELVVYRACFIGLKRRSIINLVKAAILSYREIKDLDAIALTVEAIGNKRFRFKEFTIIAKFIKKSSKAGLSEAEVSSIYVQAPKMGFSKDRLENFAAAYLTLRKDKVKPEQAMDIVKKNKRALIRAKDETQLKDAISTFADPNEELWDELETGLQEHSRIRINLDDPPPGKKQKWNKKKLDRSVRYWLKTPYLWGGCTKRGVDCSCFVRHVINDQFKDVSIPRVSRDQAKLGKSVKIKEMKTGDLVFFGADPGKKRITHVGIFLQGNQFAHASSSRGVVIHKLSYKYWKTRLLKVKRIIK